MTSSEAPPTSPPPSTSGGDGLVFFSAYLWIILTAFLWGSTDPLLKHFGAQVEARKHASNNAKKNSFLKETFFELLAFFGDWKYLLAFLANQLGGYKNR